MSWFTQGDLLLRIDPVPYQTNVAAAEAQLDLSRAALDPRRLVSAQRSNAEMQRTDPQGANNLGTIDAYQERLKP